ncbi:MAG: TetR/AcrR family transcriptional regulator [SAR86 cluster bacterium]|nr:TetR/AcrR family transcriptional regulator [SAR86 cluster bacterium]
MDQNIKISTKRIKKKDLILESAVSIFSQHGYNNTKLEQITKSLDLTDKSIYYYFNSKADLFLEVILSIQLKLNKLIESINRMEATHLDKIKTYTNKAMTINGLTLLMQIPKSLSEFAKYDHIKLNEAKQYQTWTNWFQQGQSDGSMIHGDPDEHRNFLFGSLFYLHHWYAITDNESYAHIQPFIEKMIDRMYSTQFQRLQ